MQHFHFTPTDSYQAHTKHSFIQHTQNSVKHLNWSDLEPCPNQRTHRQLQHVITVPFITDHTHQVNIYKTPIYTSQPWTTHPALWILGPASHNEPTTHMAHYGRSPTMKTSNEIKPYRNPWTKLWTAIKNNCSMQTTGPHDNSEPNHGTAIIYKTNDYSMQTTVWAQPWQRTQARMHQGINETCNRQASECIQVNGPYHYSEPK